MDPEVHLRNMEEELIQNQLRTDRIEATLQAILNKLDMSQHGIQDGPSFGIVELEKMSVWGQHYDEATTRDDPRE